MVPYLPAGPLSDGIWYTEKEENTNRSNWKRKAIEQYTKVTLGIEQCMLGHMVSLLALLSPHISSYRKQVSQQCLKHAEH